MKIWEVPGRKNKHGKDKIVMVKTESSEFSEGEAITIEDVLTILKLKFENEDRIYPQELGFKGRWMLLEAIEELGRGSSVEKICLMNKLQPKNTLKHERNNKKIVTDNLGRW